MSRVPGKNDIGSARRRSSLVRVRLGGTGAPAGRFLINADAASLWSGRTPHHHQRS
jgi:hypothetical protein